MIALLRAVRRLDEAVVFDEVGIPLVGLAAQEAVEAVEAHLERPLLAARARGDVLLGDVVVLAQPEGAPAVVLEDLPDAWRTAAGCGHAAPGNPLAASVMAAMPLRWWLRPVRMRGAGGRAQGAGMPLRVGQAVGRQPVQRRHVDPAAVGRPGGQAGVIVQHDQDVRGSRGGLLRGVRSPVRNGIADVELDDALERRRGLLRPRRQRDRRAQRKAEDPDRAVEPLRWSVALHRSSSQGLCTYRQYRRLLCNVPSPPCTAHGVRAAETDASPKILTSMQSVCQVAR